MYTTLIKGVKQLKIRTPVGKKGTYSKNKSINIKIQKRE